MLEIILKGILIGLCISVPVGPIGSWLFSVP